MNDEANGAVEALSRELDSTQARLEVACGLLLNVIEEDSEIGIGPEIREFLDHMSVEHDAYDGDDE